jgi:hypothetical protein
MPRVRLRHGFDMEAKDAGLLRLDQGRPVMGLYAWLHRALKPRAAGQGTGRRIWHEVGCEATYESHTASERKP